MYMKKFTTENKSFWQNDCHFNFTIYVYLYICLSVCLYWFPNNIQTEAIMHYNTLLSVPTRKSLPGGGIW